MKPIKSAHGLAKWLLRLATIGLVYISFSDMIVSLNFENVWFYISSVYALLSLLLFAGGFSNTNSLTALSGFLITLVSILVFFVFIDKNVNGFASTLSIYLPLTSIGTFFWSNGNK